MEFCSAFLPQSKDMIIRIIGDSQKYELSALQLTGNLSIVYLCLSPADGWDRQKPCLTEDECMNIYLKSPDMKGESRVTSYVKVQKQKSVVESRAAMSQEIILRSEDGLLAKSESNQEENQKC